MGCLRLLERSEAFTQPAALRAVASAQSALCLDQHLVHALARQLLVVRLVRGPIAQDVAEHHQTNGARSNRLTGRDFRIHCLLQFPDAEVRRSESGSIQHVAKRPGTNEVIRFVEDRLRAESYDSGVLEASRSKSGGVIAELCHYWLFLTVW